jgi:hypothetical protein
LKVLLDANAELLKHCAGASQQPSAVHCEMDAAIN